MLKVAPQQEGAIRQQAAAAVGLSFLSQLRREWDNATDEDVGRGGRGVVGAGTVRLSDLVSVSRTLLIRTKIVQCISMCVD